MSSQLQAASFGLARIKIILHEVKEFYVPGDTISGKLILTFLKSSCSFKSVTLLIRCQEVCEFEEGDERIYTRWEGAKTSNFDELLVNLNGSGSGVVESSFSIYLDPENCRSLPPSIVLEGGRNSAVIWSVRATAEVSRRDSKHFINDVHPFEFYPTDVDSSPITMALHSNLDLSPIRFRLPLRLPQWPAKFSVQLELDRPSKEVSIECVRMHLEKRVLVMNRSKSMTTHETTLLAQLNDVTLSKTNRRISVSCQLKKREPAGFSSYRFGLQYLFRAEYLYGYKMRECVIVVDVMPPSPELRTSSCRHQSEKHHPEQPPDYSES